MESSKILILPKPFLNFYLGLLPLFCELIANYFSYLDFHLQIAVN
jgi:outer membrane protein OmpA-like peptidoglycan-associated protein/uncharacterized protein YidB (DUF937 family)